MEWQTRIRPVDLLCAASLAALLAVTLVRRPPPEGWWVQWEYLGLLAGQGVMVFLDARGRTWRVLHAFYPALAILLVFDSLRIIIPLLNSTPRDALLVRLDHALFGVHPTVWLERITVPWLTDLMHLAYLTYYPMPILIGCRLWLRGEENAFDKVAFTLVAVYLVSYGGYMLVPALGPSFELRDLQTIPLDGWISPAIREAVVYLEGVKFDAFPSGHTAIAVAVLGLAWRMDQGLVRWLAPTVAALIVSTVYTRYHYVMDVLAGILLGLAGVWLGPGLAGVAARIRKSE